MKAPILLHYNLSERVNAFSTTREDGYSTGAYSSFNANHYCGDDPDAVNKNRELLVKELGIRHESLIIPHQTHGKKVLLIDKEFMTLAPAEKAFRLEGIDALITALPDICIAVSTADCVPILLYDKGNNVVAAIHAGWRGTVSRIINETIALMEKNYQTDPANIHACIGPSISAKAFEVGDEVYEAFATAGFPMEQIAHRETEKWHIDLWKANCLELENNGTPTRNIQITGICTHGNAERFFSARRLGIHSGRILSGISLKP